MSIMSLGTDRRMREMMRQRRVDVLELYHDKVGATLERALGACEQCGSIDTCLDWLESDGSPGTAGFCPNNKLFEQFKVD